MGWAPVPDVCAVVLAAGLGLRLRPLTERVPKALCPVGNVPLLDLALARVRSLGIAEASGDDAQAVERVAVNASYLADQVVAHVGTRAHLSVERDRPLGTAGALGQLRDWIDGRGVLAVNADAYLSPDDVTGFLDGWDGTTVRLLGVPTTPDDVNRFGAYRFAGMSLLPWHRVKDLPAEPSTLVAAVWRPAEAAGELEVVRYAGRYLDAGTPADYLAANLDAAGGGNLVAAGAVVTGRCERSVGGAGAVVAGDLTRSVVWPGGRVAAGEHLVDAVRAGADLTVTMSGC
ncbi:MAG: NTP transferase domain-containing protein [Micromonosporaceae bacterium]|nr:NTP transferase domain-containing protein [Micromonosporaceae bacterium]